MKLPRSIERMAVRLVLRKYGPVVQKLISAIVAAVVANLAGLLPGADAIVTEPAILALIWLIIDAGIQRIPGEILARYGEHIQLAVNAVRPASMHIPVDGYAGPATWQAVDEEMSDDERQRPL